MKERFFLILSTSGGAGHIRAAQALHQAVRSSKLPIRSEHFDCLDFTSRLFKQLYSQSYLAMVNRIPELWGYFYTQTEKKPYAKKGLLKIFDHFNYQRYLNALRSKRPDAILCTHFLPYVSISERLHHTTMNAPIFAVTTDFDVHQLWVNPVVTRYYVHHEESAWQLTAKGVNDRKIAVKGIPVLREFGQQRGAKASRQILGIPGERFTVLVLSGGFGVGRIEPLVDHVASTLADYSRRRFNLLVVCGKNDRVRSHLEKKKFPPNIETRIFGYVTNVHDLMAAADILISKSGGLTSAEAMSKHVPMIIVDPIPGQETRNAEMIVENGAGFLALDLPNVSYKLRRAIENPALLRRARAGTCELAKPHAAMDIVHDVYAFLERHR
jgi:processive 1,2-diacylglycerol beta-glucosyltransferase